MSLDCHTQMFIEYALIDADSIYFRAALSSQSKSNIRKVINSTMNDIKRNTGAPNLMVAVKGRGNFRKDLYPKYKSNRKEQPPEIKEALNYGHSYMVDRYSAVMADGMEADDLVSIWAMECRTDNLDHCVVGIDKDLLQIPGWHYNFGKRNVSFVEDREARYNLMVQCLTGDGTDNIPGIRGIGPKKATGILKGVPEQRMWNRVQAAWRMHRAGSPILSRRLLEMLKSWEELEDIRDQIERKTSERKQDVRDEEQTQDS